MEIKYFVKGTIGEDNTDFEFVIYQRKIEYKETDYQLQLFEITNLKDLAGKEIIKPKLLNKFIQSSIKECVLNLKKYNQKNDIIFKTLKLETASKKTAEDDEIDNFIRENLK